jgi:hypothetical protein
MNSEPKSTIVSEEARLLKDLDLSSRQETVSSKPNPWNIVKIHAPSRPRLSINKVDEPPPISNATELWMHSRNMLSNRLCPLRKVLWNLSRFFLLFLSNLKCHLLLSHSVIPGLLDSHYHRRVHSLLLVLESHMTCSSNASNRRAQDYIYPRFLACCHGPTGNILIPKEVINSQPQPAPANTNHNPDTRGLLATVAPPSRSNLKAHLSPSLLQDYSYAFDRHHCQPVLY